MKIGLAFALWLFKYAVQRVWKPLVALSILQFAVMWNATYVSIIHINSPAMQTPVAMLKLLTMQEPNGASVNIYDPAIMKYAMMISIPSIGLLLVFRRFFTWEVFISRARE